MASFLELLELFLGLVVVFFLVVLVFVLLSPSLVTGTLTPPSVFPCYNGKQWITYDCLPNPLTGFGCIIPDSGNLYITKKQIAVQNPSCQVDKNGKTIGTRVISFVWQQDGDAGPCRTRDSATVQGNPPSFCCTFNKACVKEAKYNCVRTDQPLGGENQCTPNFLPAPYPNFDINNIPKPLILEIPCSDNYCKS